MYVPGALPIKAISGKKQALDTTDMIEARPQTCDVRPRTSVRAPGHPHHDRVVPQAIFLADLLYFLY